MEWYQPENAYNIVRDWNKAQGLSHPTDEVNRVRRDINVRYVSIENSSRDSYVGVAIESSMCGGPDPAIKFVLAPGEVRAIAINTHGGPAQYITPLNPSTGKRIGTTTVLSTNASQFVLREGMNEWFTHKFAKSYVYHGN